MKSVGSVFAWLVLAAVAGWCQSGAADSDLRALFEATRTGNLPRAQALIGSGVDVNARTADGMTPLMLASEGGHKQIVQLLLANGAEVNARIAYYGISALTLAMRGRETDPQIVELLLAAGAQTNLRDDRERLPTNLLKLK